MLKRQITGIYCKTHPFTSNRPSFSLTIFLKLFIIFSEQSSIIAIIPLSLEPENKGDRVCLKKNSIARNKKLLLYNENY